MAREVTTKDFLEANIATIEGFNNTLNYDYTSYLDYNTGTPLDPVWTRMAGGIKCGPINWNFKVLWIDTPQFNINVDLGSAVSGFISIPSEVKHLMAIYVSRMIKLHELDALEAPTFNASTTIDADDFIDSEGNNILGDDEGFDKLITDLTDDASLYLGDEDVELSSASVNSRKIQLEVLKNKVSSIDANSARKVVVLQNDVAIYQQNLLKYQQQSNKINKDLEQLVLKYNEAIASLNGQPFTGKATSSDLDKLKQEVANLKNQLGRGRKK